MPCRYIHTNEAWRPTPLPASLPRDHVMLMIMMMMMIMMMIMMIIMMMIMMIMMMMTMHQRVDVQCVCVRACAALDVHVCRYVPRCPETK